MKTVNNREFLTKENIYYLYKIKGFSDREISEIYNVDRTYIAHLRKEYRIPSRLLKSTGRLGELEVLERLIEMFGKDNVLDMNEVDKTYPYDILLFGKIRIEVKSARIGKDGRFCFSFSNAEERGIDANNPYVFITKTGRTIKNLDYTCDYLCLVFIEDEYTFSFIPTNQKNDLYKKSTSTIRLSNIPKRYINNWHVFNI